MSVLRSKQANNKPSVLSYAGFRNLWMGQLVSGFGDVFHFLVFYWWAAVIGGPVGTSIVMSCSIGTYVVLTMYAGTVADRIDRRKLMFWSDIGCAVVAGIMAITAFVNSRPPIWVLCALAILLKVAYVFQVPARNASIPRLVPEDRVLEANSLNQASGTAMPLVGNMVGAILLAAVFKMNAALAYVTAFVVNGLTFVGSALFMAKLPAIEPERETEPKHPFHDAKEGMAFIWRHPVLRTSMLLFFAFEFFLSPFMPAYIVAAQTTMKEGFSLFGFQVQGPALLSLLETGFFLGFVIGSLIVYKRPLYKVGRSYILFVTLGAIAMAPMGLVPSVAGFWSLNFACGLLFPFGVLPLQSYMQTAAPDEFRGRVNAGIGMGHALAAPFGLFLAGPLIATIGLAGTFAYIGIGLALASMFGLLSRDFRRAVLPRKQETEEVVVEAPVPLEPAVALGETA